MQTITRKGSFDAAHRILDHEGKCKNIHGHTYHYELTFKFHAMQKIGYAVDFSDIKKVFCSWIDDMFDHGSIVNSADKPMIDAAMASDSKFYAMRLNGEGEYCNPSVENIAKEIFLSISCMCSHLYGNKLMLSNVRLWETPNCFTDCEYDSVHAQERHDFLLANNYRLFKEADKRK